MSSVIKLQQRLSDLSQKLMRHDLTDDERDDIEAEIDEIETALDEEFNHHDNEDDY